MEKKYLVIKLETKESEIPNGYHTTTRTEYFGVTEGYPIHHDTLEEAEEELARTINKWEKYTILPIYVWED